MENWKNRNLEKQEFGKMEIGKNGNKEKWKIVKMEIWKNWIFGKMEI